MSAFKDILIDNQESFEEYLERGIRQDKEFAEKMRAWEKATPTRFVNSREWNEDERISPNPLE